LLKEAFHSLIEELRRKKFRISDGIIAQALMQAGERF
jgi:predicted nucleic acid-binding protein